MGHIDGSSCALVGLNQGTLSTHKADCVSGLLQETTFALLRLALFHKEQGLGQGLMICVRVCRRLDIQIILFFFSLCFATVFSHSRDGAFGRSRAFANTVHCMSPFDLLSSLEGEKKKKNHRPPLRSK